MAKTREYFAKCHLHSEILQIFINFVPYNNKQDNMTAQPHPDKLNHPITAETEVINEHGLMVFDNIRRMPNYNEQFVTPYMTISLNLQGWVKAECGMRSVVFNRHDIAILSPNLMLCTRESSDDYHAMLIVMSPAFQEEMKRRFPALHRDMNHYLYRQDIPLNDRQFEMVRDLFLVMKGISESQAKHRKYMLGSMMETLFLMLQEYRLQNGIEEHRPMASEELFTRFHENIVKHYHESHEVRFYAKLQNLSPKCFALTIRKQTGIRAHEWINNYVTMQAKRLLLHERKTSIQQIARKLGFPDQAIFSRFFKTNAGMSPSEYRALF